MTTTTEKPVDAVPEKLCVFCKHIYINDSRGCGGTYTGPWGEKGPACAKGHFDEYNSDFYDIEEYREFILQAGKCPDYEQVKT